MRHLGWQLTVRTGTASRILVSCIVGLLLVLLAAGCAHFQAREFPLQQDTSNINAHSLEDPGLRKYMEKRLQEVLSDWPLRTWDFPTLTLVAWYFHPSLAVARSQWKQAQSDAIAAGRFTNAVTSSQSLSLNKPRDLVSQHTADSKSGRARLDFSSAQRFWLESAGRISGKQSHHLANALRLAKSARLRGATLEWKLCAGVRTNLLGYVATRRAETLLEKLEALLAQRAESEAINVATDSIPHLELSVLHLHLAQTRLGLIRTRLKCMELRSRLADSLALPLGALIGVDVSYNLSRSVPEPLEMDALRRQALLSRPDVLNVLVDYAAAEDAVRFEFAKRHPDLEFDPSCSWDRDKNRWTVDLEANLPPRSRWQGPLANAEARRSAAAARLLSLQTDIIDDLQHCAAVYRVTANELAHIDTLVAANRRYHDTVQAQFRIGIGDAREAFLARVQLVAGDLSRLEAQVNHQTALGLLEDAVQQPAELIEGTDLFAAP